MTGLFEMGGGVPAGRRIAAADVSAGLADPQLDPFLSQLQAFLAALTARRRRVCEEAAMRACGWHNGIVLLS